ncbi:MAG TPA: hypothetical protein VGM90_05705 [Kofleriaceae bacterium]|jgi:hypothetical protein
MATTLDGLRKKIGPTLEKLDEMDGEAQLAAPVDIEAMFQHGVVEATAPTAETKKGTLITGPVKQKIWDVVAPTWVIGDVTVDSLTMTADLVIDGALTVTGDAHGQWEPNVLTVLGKVTLGRAIMEGQFIMQFLGGGTIETLIDDEGGADELLELLAQSGSKLKVGTKSDKLPKK